MYVGIHVKCLLFLSDFNETSVLWRFWKNTKRVGTLVVATIYL